MAATRIMRYGHLIFMMVLAVYLILVWMYFKDNAEQLNSSGLLLWFITIPLLLIGAIIAIKWWPNRINNQTLDQPKTAEAQDKVQLPATHKLFIHSSVCLPEGSTWSEVVDNDDDLTVLSDTLSDFDGLPILTKPIAKLSDPETPPYHLLEDDVTDTEISPLTLRLYALIHEQLSLSEAILSDIAQYFDTYQQPVHEPNSAAHIHPEWQQHYLISADLASADESNTDSAPTDLSNPSIAKLAIYLVLPASADTALLISAVEEQMLAYGIAQSLLFITPIIADESESIAAINSAIANDPVQFIRDYLLPLSQSVTPEICLLLIADSQINEQWLESSLFAANLATTANASGSSNIVPTEAGVLLVFYNQAAQNVLNLEDSVGFLLAEIFDSDAKIQKNLEADTEVNSHITNRLSYPNNLNTIKNLLRDNLLSLTPTTTVANPTSPPATNKKQLNDEEETTSVSSSETSLNLLSDISSEIQPYDLSVFLSFAETFIDQSTLVETHHLGSYMPLNTWLKPFISLSLFVNLVYDGQQESEKLFLITQHKPSCLLWTVDATPTF